MKFAQIFICAVAALAGVENLLVAAAPFLTKQNAGDKLFRVTSSAARGKKIKNSYIVSMKPEVDDFVVASHLQKVSDLVETRNRPIFEKRSFLETSEVGTVPFLMDFGDFKAYHGYFDDATVNFIRSQSDHVEFIEMDSLVTATHALQGNATWNLARLCNGVHPDPMNLTSYSYPETAGNDTTVYVVDTGVYLEHSEFDPKRVRWGGTFTTDSKDFDCNGHGTHVAGTIAGRSYGVAKKANIVAVKVLSCEGEGSMSGVVNGLQFVLQDHLKRSIENGKRKARSVINMSLGGSKSTILDRAVESLSKVGVMVVVAAGNEFANACETSPAGAPSAITIGATDIHDYMAYFSNHGKCVDIFAPGVSIKSSWISNPSAVNTISGTSMASPHVAGLVALVFSTTPLIDYTSATMIAALLEVATNDTISHLPPHKHRDGLEEQNSQALLSLWGNALSSNLVGLASNFFSNTIESMSEETIKAKKYPGHEGKTRNILAHVPVDAHQKSKAPVVNSVVSSNAASVPHAGFSGKREPLSPSSRLIEKPNIIGEYFVPYF